MIMHSRRAGRFPRIALHLAAITLLCATCVSAQWQRVSVDSPAFSLEVPEGWEVREVEGRGARLLPPENGPVVEIVAWNALRPPATPENAAVEHEAVLSRAVNYRREGIEQIETDEGASALVVGGRVRSRGITESSIFCAYAEGATHYVLGTFASEEALADFRSETLDRMILSFRAEPGAAPVTYPPQPLPEPVEPAPLDPEEPEPPQPEEPEEPEPDPVDAPRPGAPVTGEAQPGEAPSTMEIGGQTEPLGPEVREPHTPWIQHISPTGFSLSMPIDWEVETLAGLITVTPAVAAAGASMALIWPVTGDDPGAESALRQALSRLAEAQLTRVSSVRDAGRATVVEGVVGGGRRIAATWAFEDGFGLLRAAIAPEQTWHDALPDLARIAGNFRPGRWRVSHGPRVQVTGDHGLVRWTLPEGWEVRGGAREDAGEFALDIEALGPPEGSMRIGWQQPTRPRFRALTQLLESLGWREGERYSVPEGGGGLLIYRRRDPEEMARDLLLPRHPRQLRISEIEARPPDGSIAGLLPHPEAVGQIVTVSGGSTIGPRERLYLAATARAEGALASTCWEAAALRADAPEGRLADAVGALAMMVRSASVRPGVAREEAAAITRLIERAQRAMGAIPAEMLPETNEALTGVLGGDGPPIGGDATWQAPAADRDWWSERADAGGEVDTLGEPLGTRPGG